MKNIKIWHTNDDIPEFVEDVVFIVNSVPYCGTYSNGLFYYAPDSNLEQSFRSEVIDSWAYVYQLIATSKALDVAIDALDKIDSYPGNQGAMEIIAGMTTTANKAKNEISEIMKGGK